MRCRVAYYSPRNHIEFYFVDFRDSEGSLAPIGCFGYRKNKAATVFETKSLASEVAQYLCSIGYEARVVKVNS